MPLFDDPVEARAGELAKSIEELVIKEASDVALTAIAGALIRILIDYGFNGDEAAAVIEDLSTSTLASVRDYEAWRKAFVDSGSEQVH